MSTKAIRKADSHSKKLLGLSKGYGKQGIKTAKAHASKGRPLKKADRRSKKILAESQSFAKRHKPLDLKAKPFWK